MAQKYKNGLVIQDYKNSESAFRENAELQIDAQNIDNQRVLKENPNGFNKIEVNVINGDSGGNLTSEIVNLQTGTIEYNGKIYYPSGEALSTLATMANGSEKEQLDYAAKNDEDVRSIWFIVLQVNAKGDYLWRAIDNVAYIMSSTEENGDMNIAVPEFPVLSAGDIVFPAVLEGAGIAVNFNRVMLNDKEVGLFLTGEFNFKYYKINLNGG